MLNKHLFSWMTAWARIFQWSMADRILSCDNQIPRIFILCWSNSTLNEGKTTWITLCMWKDYIRINIKYLGPRNQGSIPGRDKKFPLLHSVDTDSRANPASYPVGIGDCFPGSKPASAWSSPLTFNYAKVKKEWSYFFFSPYFLWRGV
jgi:hypothetical protein